MLDLTSGEKINPLLAYRTPCAYAMVGLVSLNPVSLDTLLLFTRQVGRVFCQC